MIDNIAVMRYLSWNIISLNVNCVCLLVFIIQVVQTDSDYNSYLFCFTSLIYKSHFEVCSQQMGDLEYLQNCYHLFIFLILRLITQRCFVGQCSEGEWSFNHRYWYRK